MTKQIELKGTITAIATPFTDNSETIDYESLEKLIEYQLQAGVEGLVACGSTAEAASLTDEEYKDVIRFVNARCKGKIKCIGGIITNNTKKACEAAHFMAAEKLDAALVVTPPYIKPTQEGIIEHFKAIKASSHLPLVAYNIPGRSATLIQPETIARLNESSLICGIKDSTGSIENLLEVVSLVGESLDILSGEDSLVYPVMACGGKGVISASANLIPESFVELTTAALLGNYEEALAVQTKILNMIKALFAETNPVPLKAGLQLKGIIKSDAVRVPLTKAKIQTRERIKSLLG